MIWVHSVKRKTYIVRGGKVIYLEKDKISKIEKENSDDLVEEKIVEDVKEIEEMKK